MTHNQIEYWKLQEQKRANLRSEELTGIQRQEEIRHNLAGEGLQGRTLEETARHNVVTEGEAFRANVAREQENYRADTAREAETHRANVVYERENERAHRASEALGYSNVNLGYSQVAERYAELSEETRHNQYNEGIAYIETELERTRDNREAAMKARLASEDQRHHEVTEAETRRSNIAQENISKKGNELRQKELVESYVRDVGNLFLGHQRNVTNGVAAMLKVLPLALGQ